MQGYGKTFWIAGALCAFGFGLMGLAQAMPVAPVGGAAKASEGSTARAPLLEKAYYHYHHRYHHHYYHRHYHHHW